MELKLMSLSEACMHDPEKPTYALRIMSEAYRNTELQPSGLYTIREYFFDDLQPGCPGWERNCLKSLYKSTAHGIVTDFRDEGLDKDILLIHAATKTNNRGREIALALNDLFNLGFNVAELEGPILAPKETGIKQYIRRMVVEAGREILK